MSSYNYGIDFGYDQIMSNSALEELCFSAPPPPVHKKIRNEDKMLMGRLKEMEKKESLQNYLEDNIRPRSSTTESCDCHRDIKYDFDMFKKSLDELQRKNDMLTMFIIFLVIFVVMQFNSSSRYLIPLSNIDKSMSSNTIVAL